MRGYKSRITGVFVGCMLLVACVLGRAAYIQLWGDSKLERLAKRQFRSRVLLSPRRGLILDRSGEPLAINVEVNSIAANPKKVKHKRELARYLSKHLSIPMKTLVSKFDEKREFVWIKRHVPEEFFSAWKKSGLADREGGMPEGLWLVKESKRVYPHNEVAAQVLGGVSIDSQGVDGVEYWRNEKLQGTVVALDAIKDALGRPAFIDATEVKAIKDGDNIRLSIDASLQYSVEQELKSSIERHRADGGQVIVMDASNGQILAVANQPGFNPNLRGQDPKKRRNRALVDGYEPGSTVKPVLLASALLNGMKSSDLVHGNFGKMMLQGKTISEAESHEKFEWMSLEKMIQVSSNVGAAKLALRLGAEKYLKTLRLFGFGSKTGSGFPGEISGILPSNPSTVQPLTLANIGFGHGLMVNALQIVRAYAVFLNGGYLVQPTFFADEAATAKPERILSEKHVDEVLRALKKVTAPDGTGKLARLEGFEVAGKTGTAQTVDPQTKKYSKSHYISSFAGFAVNVEPKLVVFASLDGPKGVYYAAQTTAPLFREVLRAAANRFSLPVNPDLELPSQKLAQAKPEKDEIAMSRSLPTAAELFEALEGPVVKPGAVDDSGDAESYEIPDFSGLSAREALQALEGKKLRVQIKGFGFVRSQSPRPGAVLKPDSRIELHLDEM